MSVSEIKTMISTRIDPDSGSPTVNILLVDANSERIILPITFTPSEARQTAHWIMEAAEAVDLDAHLVTVLRSRKMSEEDIMETLHEVRQLRGVVYATVPHSHMDTEPS